MLPCCVYVCVLLLQSKKGEGGRFRLEVWFKTDDSHACGAVCASLSQSLSETTPGFGLREFTAPSGTRSRPGWFTTGPELQPFVEDALGVAVGGIERLRSGFLNSAFAVHLASAPTPDRTGGVVCREGSDLVFRLPGRNPAHIPTEVAVTTFVSTRCQLPVPGILSSSTGNDSTLPYIFCTRIPGVPLSTIWRAQAPAMRFKYLEQLVRMVLVLRQQAFPTIGALNEGMSVVPVAAASAGVDASSLSGSDPLVTYYQSALTERIQKLVAHPRAQLFAPILAKLTAFRDVEVPALCAGYFGGFSLGHTRLRLKYILVDPSTSLVTGVLGWEHAASVCDEDGVSAVAHLAESGEEVEYVASVVKAARVAALPGIENREMVRRVLSLCDKAIEFQTWYTMKAPIADAFLKAAVSELSVLLSTAVA